MKLFAKIFIFSLIGFVTVSLPSPVYSAVKQVDVKPERQKEIRDYIKIVVRINTKSYCGSGTICNYDYVKNTAYILTCAHLFASDDETTCKVEMFYRDDEKLDKPEVFKAKLLAINRVRDLSLLTFKPKWEITHHPFIAPKDIVVPLRETLFAVGCDQATEPALYRHVLFETDVIVYKCWWNKVRGGRSGGGLYLWDTYYLIGVCHGYKLLEEEDESWYINLKNIYDFLNENDLTYLTKKFKIPKGKKLKVINVNDDKPSKTTISLPPNN